MAKERKKALASVISSILLSIPVLFSSVSTAASAGTPVTVDSVVRANSESLVTVVGTITASQAAVLSAASSGPIKEVAFASGDAVKKGQLLFQLDDAVQRAALARAEARAKVSAARYQRSLKLSEMTKQAAFSQQGLEEVKAVYLQDQAAVDMAKAVLQSRKVVAPFTGTAGVLSVHAGDYVTTGKGLLHLVSYKDPQVTFSVPERAIKGVQLGKEIEVSTPLLPGKALKAKITFVSPTLDPESRTLLCMATLEHADDSLRPGTFVEVDFSMQENIQAVQIPEKALVLDTNGYFVYRVVKGKAIKTPVVIGSRCQGKAFITHGLRAGEKVVTSGQGELTGGQDVRLSR